MAEIPSFSKCGYGALGILLFVFSVASAAPDSSKKSPIPAAETTAPEAAKEASKAQTSEKKTQGNKESSEKSEASKEKTEEPADDEPQLNEAQKAERKSGIAKLLKKLTKSDGSPAAIVILTPLDYTTLHFADLAEENIIASINRYGKFNLKSIAYTPASLTLEEFRKVIAKYQGDLVILCVLKPTNFDLFLYDSRSPYNIYAHSEVLPEEVQYQLEASVVEEYTKVIVRKTLYAYMQDQSYELPRTEYTPFLRYEIPRWIASNQSLQLVNRELVSRFYGALSVGAALSKGPSSSQSWTSNVLGFQLGARIAGPISVEAGADLFSYNALSASAKYLLSGRDDPFRLSAGFGVGYTVNTHTLNWDPTYSQPTTDIYAIPSISITFPIVDVHFKLEAKTMVAIDGNHFVFLLMPGLLALF